MRRLLSTLILLSLIITAVFSLCACNEEKEIPTKSRVISYTYFNTVSSITVYGEIEDELLNSYVKEANRILGYYHKLFDIYYDYSGVNNLRLVNQKAGREPVAVDDELIDFLEYCKELFTLTEGKTNVMMGAVLKLWHLAREDAEYDPAQAWVPTEADLSAANEHTSITALSIDREGGTVYISDPKASIDVGAIGKGYATEKLYERLKEMGAEHVALNIGGNIRTIGVKPDGKMWEVGITNPDKTSADFATRIYLGESSCVTSGDYERYFYKDGVKYHHVIDPDTLYPAGYFSSITVITENSALADALSTALFCLSHKEGVELLKKIGTPVEVIWISTDGRVVTSDGIHEIK